MDENKYYINFDTASFNHIAHLVNNTRNHPENLEQIRIILQDNPSLVNKSIKLCRLDHDEISLLIIACASATSTYETVELLLEFNADVDFGDDELMTPLFYVLLELPPNDAIRTAKLLLDYGADINALDVDGFSILMYLINHRADYEIIKYVVEDLEIDLHVINCRNCTALDYAKNYPEILTLIKNKIESDNDTSLDIKCALD